MIEATCPLMPSDRPEEVKVTEYGVFRGSAAVPSANPPSVVVERSESRSTGAATPKWEGNRETESPCTPAVTRFGIAPSVGLP
jgi:hypothetical protein